MLNQVIYTALGASLLVKDKVEEEITKLEEKGKLKTDDAKSFLESLETNGLKEDERIKEQIKSSLKEIIDELGLATKEDIEALRKEIKKGK